MPDIFGPFSNAPWGEDQWYKMATAWAPDGVIEEGGFPIALSGLSVTIGAGSAAVGGMGFNRAAPVTANSVDPNTHSSYSRRDRVVIRRSLASKEAFVHIIKGTPAASPVAPAIAQDRNDDWDLALYSFLVPPQSGTAISGVIDERYVNKPRPMYVATVLPASAPNGSICFLVEG